MRRCQSAARRAASPAAACRAWVTITDDPRCFARACQRRYERKREDSDLRFREGWHHARRQWYVEGVENCRRRRVRTADGEQFDHTGIAQHFLRALVVLVGDTALCIKFVDEIVEREFIL